MQNDNFLFNFNRIVDLLIMPSLVKTANFRVLSHKSFLNLTFWIFLQDFFNRWEISIKEKLVKIYETNKGILPNGFILHSYYIALKHSILCQLLKYKIKMRKQ